MRLVAFDRSGVRPRPTASAPARDGCQAAIREAQLLQRWRAERCEDRPTKHASPLGENLARSIFRREVACRRRWQRIRVRELLEGPCRLVRSAIAAKSLD